MRVIDLYKVSQWDGGDRHNFKFYFSNQEAVAEYLANNKFDIVDKVQIRVYNTYEETKQHAKFEIRERALAKLNDQEKEALGLNISRASVSDSSTWR